MAKILTRGSVAALSTLDAGDTVECYVLSRLSKLETFSEATSVQVGNSENETNETAPGGEINGLQNVYCEAAQVCLKH